MLLHHPYVLPVSLLLNSEMGMRVAAGVLRPYLLVSCRKIFDSVKPGFKDGRNYFWECLLPYVTNQREVNFTSVWKQHNRHSRKYFKCLLGFSVILICDHKLKAHVFNASTSHIINFLSPLSSTQYTSHFINFFMGDIVKFCLTPCNTCNFCNNTHSAR